MPDIFSLNTVLSIGMLAVFLLCLGGGRMLLQGGDRKRALLMLVTALVVLINVLLIAWP